MDSLDSLAEEYTVVVNCAGLGARWLCQDKAVLPLRGQVGEASLTSHIYAHCSLSMQVLRLSAPWIKTALYADDVYVIPGQKWVTVGGTRQYNNWMVRLV